ncbi:E3 ubiquitin-protein ligase TRIM21-like [Boleophthalmus pectinirostris]|uniref:E3 ubiquitin-protein ligase TRIM21-like n=1 Tax=Boleophthalmus pectinirostris TaxID=150288 RepID=UPI00242ECCD1|nr:E3 ubiquitin-protein ligase TRIM21-like [Boleophthalmus pectinirostris]
MASSSDSPSPANPLEKQLICSICLEIFKDLVTTSCGHSFCEECLDRSLRLDNSLCPLCKNYILRTPQVNIILRSVVEQMKNEKEEEERRRFRGRPGQVPCDMCTKMAATKSCLICLSSYCDDHLQIHSANQRLKGHKLVDPVEDLDQRACLTHGRPLELYSRKQEKCICVLCMEKGEEGVVSSEEEWANKKVNTVKSDLKESIVKRKTKMDQINASLKSCKDQLDSEWWAIDDVFSEVISTVEAAHAKALKPLEERRQRLKQEASDLCETLRSEVSTLEKTISELEHISSFEDHVLFLQKYPSVKEPGVKDWTSVELDTSVSFGSLRKITTEAMEQIQGHLDKLTALGKKNFPKFAVDVTLDPNSSHKRLVLSEDQKEVFDGESEAEVIDDLERFDVFGSILGREGQDSGSRAYWEVQVEGKSGWDLGVTSAKAKRKGKLTLSPENGYWAIVHYEGDKYAALTAPPVCVQLKDKPQKVGVFLDYDEGLLSFYNVTDEAHIYSFSKADFKGEVLPYFSPHVKNETNTGALVISTVKSS